jgi:molybdate transport system substrate-binding protein
MKHLALIALVALVALAACHDDNPHLSIGAAASLRSAMPELVAAFEKQTGTHVDVRFGSSDALAKQVHDGAALDVLVLADEGVLDSELAAARHIIATNPIVLVGPPGLATDFEHLDSLPAGARVAVGDPASVPIGRYARLYLQQVGSWDALQPRLLFGGDAAAVVALAQSGKAQVAIVYRSDGAQAAPLVILDAPTTVPVARIAVDVLASSHHRHAADGFASYLLTPDAQAILATHELSPPTGPLPTHKPPEHPSPGEVDDKTRP